MPMQNLHTMTFEKEISASETGEGVLMLLFPRDSFHIQISGHSEAAASMVHGSLASAVAEGSCRCHPHAAGY